MTSEKDAPAAQDPAAKTPETSAESPRAIIDAAAPTEAIEPLPALEMAPTEAVALPPALEMAPTDAVELPPALEVTPAEAVASVVDEAAATEISAVAKDATVRVEDAEGQAVVADAEVAPSLIANRYEVLSLLGRGGMGAVYKVRDLALDEIVALKTLQGALARQPESLERFRGEVKLARRVTHESVARVYDLGVDGTTIFLTMEFLRGESLRERLQGQGPLSSTQSIAVLRAVCEGLEAAHRAGVIHRDLKPDNILVTKTGRIVVLDFGIAWASGYSRNDREIIGTLAYMAPEQLEGGDIGPWTDLYALGVTAFELLTGQRPWGSPTTVQDAGARMTQPPPDPRAMSAALPDTLADVIVSCMQADPSLRPDSASALEALLMEAEVEVEDDAVSGLWSDVTAAAPSTQPSRSDWGTRLAVLPLLTSNEEDAPYAAGLVEDIIDGLSGHPELRVRPWGSIAPYTNADRDLGAIGAALHVQLVIAGSLQRLGERVRVRVRILQVADGFQTWARRFDCAFTELLDLGDEITAAISEALNTEHERAQVAEEYNADAVTLSLRARHELRRCWHLGAEALQGVVELFDEALSHAPDNPRLLAGAAVAYARLGFLVDRSHVERGLALARRAKALDPGRAEAHYAMAMCFFNLNQHEHALRHLNLALRRSPHDDLIHDLMGRVRLESESPHAAIRHLERAHHLNPNNPNTRWDLARAYMLDGRDEEADRILALPLRELHDERLRDLLRMRFALWRGAVIVGVIEPPEWDDFAVLFFQVTRAILSTGKAPIEQRQALEAIVEDGKRTPRLRIVQLQILAEIAIAEGDIERCFIALNDVINAGLRDRVWLARCPLFVSLQQAPRFLALSDPIQNTGSPSMLA